MDTRLPAIVAVDRIPYRSLRADVSDRQVAVDISFQFFPVSGGTVPTLGDVHDAMVDCLPLSDSDTSPMVVVETVETVVEKVLREYLQSFAFADERRFLAFAESVVYEPHVPISRSPIAGASLWDLARSASHSGGGAVIGWLAAGGSMEPRPILLLTVPIGIVVCGAAAGVAKGLNEGLHGWITDRLAGGSLHRRIAPGEPPPSDNEATAKQQ